MNRSLKNYQPAPVSCLLPDFISDANKASEQKIQDKAHRLEKALMSYGISAEVIDTKFGPSITRFEIALRPGTRVMALTRLTDDLMFAMAVESIRIDYPIHGKPFIAVIEIPNEHQETVSLRRLVENEAFIGSSPLTVSLGLDVSREPVYCNLAKMPHLLIAGSSGTGKSVCLNAILASLLLHSSPEDVRMILIDPKYVELSPYNGIPHLLMPVITDPEQGIEALKCLIAEMERRYKIFAENKARDIKVFNEKHKILFEAEHMPSILCVIDEFSELKLVSSDEVETCISRLAAYGRAAGIHLVISTQIPSPSVVTGVIKSNIGSRIAFAVHSTVDSRSVIEQCGAETLIGKGDMLYSPVSSPRPIRCQGAFISDSEVDSITDYLREQYGQHYDEAWLNGRGRR